MAILERTTDSQSQAISTDRDWLDEASQSNDINTSLVPRGQLPHPEIPTTKEFRSRQIKVGSIMQGEKHVPFLRSSGHWLSEIGFDIGSNVQITVTSKRLVLEAGDTQPDAQDQPPAVYAPPIEVGGMCV